MSPRPRKVSDDQVFAAALRAMARLGPGELTLAGIAAEAGVTAGALVQRFGGKRELLLALAGRAATETPAMFRALRAAHRSPLATLTAYADCMAALGDTPEALARNLAYLQMDLTDPDFRVHQVAQGVETRRQLEALLRDAVAAGELRPDTRVQSLARVIEALMAGSLMTWACYQEGPVTRWMRARLDDALAPHRAGRRPAGRSAHEHARHLRPPREQG